MTSVDQRESQALGVPWELDPDRCFAPEPHQRSIAQRLFDEVALLPIVSTHSHISADLLAQEDGRFGTPVDLFVIPDHYVLRLLHGQGVDLDRLGVPRLDGAPVERDHRLIWRRFASHFDLFAGTSTGLWIRTVLTQLFDIQGPIGPDTADESYEAISACLASSAFSPRALFERFNVEVLCTTDGSGDSLDAHADLKASGLNVRPTFRPDAVIDIESAEWASEIQRLGDLARIDVRDYASYITAIEQRRLAFQVRGALATDQGYETFGGDALSGARAAALFDRALHGTASAEDAREFASHMALEMARMSSEDGLVMQLHAGARRNYDRDLARDFGPDRGADFPIAGEWTRSLQPMLNAFGNHRNFRLVLFSLDESTLTRELAPIASYYPAVRLGAPWWFLDSVTGINRFLDAVVDIAGVENLVGFNDDARAFPSIQVRHDFWRRACSNWLAGVVARGLLGRSDARRMIHRLSYELGKEWYRA